MPFAQQHRFQSTRHSALLGVRDCDAQVRTRSYEALTAAYWKPVHAYIRLRWQASIEDAEDLTQSFFMRTLEDGTLANYDAARSAFRTYLRLCVDGHVLNVRKYETRLKRSGAAMPLDFEAASDSASLDEMFHREWVRSLFSLAVEDLRKRADQRGRSVAFQIFERYDLSAPDHRPSYAALAKEFSLNEANVTNYLAAMRRDCRKAILSRLRELTANEREYRSEARALLGVAL